MRLPLLLAGLVTLVVSSTLVRADERSAIAVLKQELATALPKHWQLHLSQREHFILVSLMPPYQEAFDLWYDPQRQFATLRKLCPKPDDEIWTLLGPEQDVVLEPTVGGKSVPEMRVSCRKVLAQPSE